MSATLEDLHTAGNLLNLAITRYLEACSAIRNACITGEAADVFPRGLLIGQLNGEKELLPNYVSRLKDAELAIATAQNHSIRASASALPPEILAHIFRYVLSESGCLGSNGSRSLYSKYPELLSHVCSSWRRASTNSCDLWTHIDLATNPRLTQRTEMHIKRSGQLPLYIHILGSLNFSGGQVDADHATRIASFAARTQSIYFDQHDGAYENLALRAFLENCKPRVLTHITTDPRLYNHNGKHRWLLARGQQKPANANRNHTVPLDISQERFEDIMLGLTSFRSGGTYPMWDSKAYSGLTDLRLGGEGNIPEPWLVAILKSSPQLRSLEVYLEITNTLPTTGSVQSVPLVDLERLQVGSGCKPGLLLRWVAPGPKPLRLAFKYNKSLQTTPFIQVPFVKEQLESFLLRSNTTKVLTAIKGDYSALAEFFSTKHGVKELAIDCSYLRISTDQLYQLHLDALYLFGGIFVVEELLKLIEEQPVQNIVLWGCEFRKLYDPLTAGPLVRVSSEGFLKRCPTARFLSPHEPKPIDSW